MSRDDIIRMAKEAGIGSVNGVFLSDALHVNELERFAALVAAHEREECAEVCEKYLHTTEVLTSSPPMSSAAYLAMGAIRRRSKP